MGSHSFQNQGQVPNLYRYSYFYISLRLSLHTGCCLNQHKLIKHYQRRIQSRLASASCRTKKEVLSNTIKKDCNNLRIIPVNIIIVCNISEEQKYE